MKKWPKTITHVLTPLGIIVRNSQIEQKIVQTIIFEISIKLKNYDKLYSFLNLYSKIDKNILSRC